MAFAIGQHVVRLENDKSRAIVVGQDWFDRGREQHMSPVFYLLNGEPRRTQWATCNLETDYQPPVDLWPLYVAAKLRGEIE